MCVGGWTSRDVAIGGMGTEDISSSLLLCWPAGDGKGEAQASSGSCLYDLKTMTG